MEPQPLSSSHEAYREAFQTFLAKSTFKAAIRNYSRETAAYIMQTAAHSAATADSTIFRVLGVGSGDGYPDLEILQAIAKSLRSSHDENQKPSIHACIVEPSSSLIEEFKEAVSPLPEGLATLADVSFEWRETTFQDYIGRSLPSESNRYHMAHFICSLYYLDSEEALKNCFKQLVTGGAMFCLVAGENSYFAKVSIAKQGRLKCLSESNFYTGKDLVAIAERNNWKHKELAKVYYEIDISSCFDETSRIGGSLLDFLTHRINFRETAGPELYNEMIDFINEASISDNKGGKILRPELAVVIIYK